MNEPRTRGLLQTLRQLVLSALVLLPSLVGAASLTYLESLGKYSELRIESEKEIATASAVSTAQLAHLCVAYSRLKIYRELTDCLTKLEGQIQKGNWRWPADFPLTPAADARPLPHVLRSEMLLDFGDYRGAIAEASLGLKKLPVASSGAELWPRVKYEIHLISNLALANAYVGDTQRAAQLLRALEDIRIGWGGGSWEPIRANGLARGYMALGDYPKALSFIDRDPLALARGMVDFLAGLSLRGDSVGKFTQIPRILMLAKCFKETGKIKEARELMDKLLSERLLADQTDILWLTLYERGLIAEFENQPTDATKYYLRAIDVIELQRASISKEASKIGFVGDKQAVYARLISILIEQGKIAEAFDYVERSKSRALVDMLASKKDIAAPNAEQTRLVLAQLDAADLSAHSQDEKVPQELQIANSRNLSVARQSLRSVAPELSSLVTVTSVPSAELKALVGADETLVEYYYQGKVLYAFILDRERLLVVRLDASELAAQVQILRKALEELNSPAWKTISSRLYQRLWQPLEGQITSKSVIVVAHGALHYLPFSALQDDEGKFLIDRYGVRFLPSASVLKYLRPVMQKSDAPLLVFGNPDLGDPRLDLAFAEGEARLVGGMISGSRVMLRKDASETNFKKTGSVFTRIHFATHGKFQADDPLSSGLYLAKDADNDGVLTVGELYSMALNADLVTLSACETGIGKVDNGDDVVGLSRGFLYAGSRSIVASLWSVDDQATAALMQAFYKNLSTMNKREALRQAQIRARESFPHPFYWAAFQLTGRAD